MVASATYRRREANELLEASHGHMLLVGEMPRDQTASPPVLCDVMGPGRRLVDWL